MVRTAPADIKGPNASQEEPKFTNHAGMTISSTGQIGKQQIRLVGCWPNSFGNFSQTCFRNIVLMKKMASQISVVADLAEVFLAEAYSVSAKPGKSEQEENMLI